MSAVYSQVISYTHLDCSFIALAPHSGSGFGNLWHWLPHRIVHYNKDDVIGTIFFTESTITLLPSMVVARHQLQTVKLRHGEGPVVRPEPDGISAAVLEAGEKR